MNRWSPWSPSRRMSFVVRDRLPSWTRVAPSGLKRTVGSSNRTVRPTSRNPCVNPASPIPVRRAATMASCGSPRMASAAYRRTSSFSGSGNLSKTSWTSTSGPASAVLIRMPTGRSPSGGTSASRHESRGESDATTLSGKSPSPSTLMVRRPRYSRATSASFTPRLSSSSSASRSARLARLDASISMTSVSIGVCMGSADSQIPVSGTRTSGDREVMWWRSQPRSPEASRGRRRSVPQTVSSSCGPSRTRTAPDPGDHPKPGSSLAPAATLYIVRPGVCSNVSSLLRTISREGNESHRQRPPRHGSAIRPLFDKQKILHVRGPAWDDHSATALELRDQRRRDVRRRRRDDDGIERRGFGPTIVTVADAHLDITVPEPIEDLHRPPAERLHDLDRVDLRHELGKDCRLIPRAGAHFQDGVPRFRIKQICHQRDKKGLRTRLVFTDRERPVLIREGLL